MTAEDFLVTEPSAEGPAKAGTPSAEEFLGPAKAGTPNAEEFLGPARAPSAEEFLAPAKAGTPSATGQEVLEGPKMPALLDAQGKPLPGQSALPPIISSGEKPSYHVYNPPQNPLMESVFGPPPLVRNPKVWEEGAHNTLVKGIEAFTSPLALLTGPALKWMPLARPVVAGLFGGLGAKQVGEEAGRLSGTPNLTPGQITEGVGDIAQGGLMMLGPLAEFMEGGRLGKPVVKGASAGPRVPLVSEFGGELEAAAKGAQAQASAAPPSAEAFLGPVPEAKATLEHQVQWLREGKRDAVLVTPGAEAPEVPEGMAKHSTPAGDFIFNPEKHTPASLDAAVAENRVGEVLGYGIAEKPAPGTEAGVVVLRGADGTEKQAVVTDQDHAGAVVDATRELAGPGDQVSLENPERVLAERQAATEGGANAVSIGNQPGSVQPERAPGNEGGAAAEAGGGNRVRPETKGAEAAKEAEVAAKETANAREETARQEQIDQVVKFSLDAGDEGGKLPAGERAQNPIDAAVERMRRELGKIFGAERVAGMRRVEPDLRDSLTAKTLGISAEGRAAFEQAFGVKLTFLLGDRKLPFGGFRDERFPNQLFLDARNARPAITVASHELLHELSGRRPDLYRELDTKLQPLLKDFPEYHRQLEALYRDAGARPRGMSAAETREELYANFLGENMGKPEFWGRLQARDPGLFTRLATALKEMLDRLALKLGGLLKEDKWFHDVDQARAVLAAALSRFAGSRAGEGPPGTRFKIEDEGVGTGERATGQKLKASTASDEVKQAVSEYVYQRRTNAGDDELAAGILQKFGAAGAETALRDANSGVHGATWSRLLGQVTRSLAEQERGLRAAGDAAGAQRLAERQAALWDDTLPRITELAQSLQALHDVTDMSPDAQVARARRGLEKAANDAVDQRGAEVRTAATALEEGRKAGLEAVRQDPAVNGAARAAVDAAVAAHPDVTKAVVMEMAEPWASSKAVMDAAREHVRPLVERMGQKNGPPLSAQARQQAKLALEEVAKRAATIFAGHLQGADPHAPLVDKLQQRLGLSREKSVSLAGALNREWEAQLEAARAKIPKRIAAQRAARERDAMRAAGGLPGGSAAPTSAVDAALRNQLRQLNQKLGQVLLQEAGRQDRTQAHVAERVVQASGLTGEKADTLRDTLRNRWDALVTDAQKRALEAMQRRSGVTLTRPVKTAFDRAAQLERLGALTGDGFRDVVKDQLKLRRMTAEDAARLRELVRQAQAQPEGFMRQRAGAEVLKFTEQLKGDHRWWDVPMGVFYSNVLSGLTTPAKIVLENTNLLLGHTVTSLLSRPGELLHPADFTRAAVSAYRRGLAKGALQAADTLRTGTVSGVWAKPKPPGIMEMKPFGARLEPLNFWKWFTRIISTSHEVTFKPAWELKQTLLARDVARREGLAGPALRQRVADLMADTQAHAARARSQALTELQGLGKPVDRLDLARRTREIIEQQREENMPGSTETARDFALRTAYLNEPYGIMGLWARGTRSLLEEGRQKFPILGTGVKSQIPFTTIVANILNEKLNWTPVGLARAALSERTGKLYGRTIMEPRERAELYAKSIVGTVALTAAAKLLGDHIHGNGPSEPNKRKQLKASGWIPHSIELDGKYYSYMNTPAALGLAVIGNVKDWDRYGKGEDADSVSRTAFALKATANAIISQGMLDSLKRLFESFGSESTTEGADKLQKLMARTASSFVVPNLVQQVDRLFDPTVYDQTGMEALVKGQIPFVRRENRPVLNVLGEPVQSGPFHYWAAAASEDPLWRTLAAKQAWVPEPSKNQIIGDKKRGPDYYRAMTPDEYYTWIAQSGPEIRRRLMENLDTLTTAEPGEARKLVGKIAEEERAKAKKSFE